LAGGHGVAGFSPDGKKIIALSQDHRELEFWAGDILEKQVALQNLPEPGRDCSCFGMSPGGDFFFMIDTNGLARVWEAASGVLQRTFSGPVPPLRNAMLSPHGKYLAVCVERENFVSLFDCTTGKYFSLAGHHDFVSGLAFSPDNSTLATGSMDGNIRLWRTSDGACLGVLPGHLEETTDVAFSPDGRTLASVGQLESLKFWHLPTMREVFSEALPHAGHHLQFSPDGKRLAVNTDENQLLILEAP
jgi:WD40 repeat protein